MGVPGRCPCGYRCRCRVRNTLCTVAPGAGKTLLARALPDILPPLTAEETLEVTRIYSVAGVLAPSEPVVQRRPFRGPHHTVSYRGLVGGGSSPRPGEISLGHASVSKGR